MLTVLSSLKLLTLVSETRVSFSNCDPANFARLLCPWCRTYVVLTTAYIPYYRSTEKHPICGIEWKLWPWLTCVPWFTGHIPSLGILPFLFDLNWRIIPPRNQKLMKLSENCSLSWSRITRCVEVAVVTLSPSGHCRRFASFTVLQNIHVYLSSNAVPWPLYQIQNR